MAEYAWENWLGSVTYREGRFYRPRIEDDVIRIVRDAAKGGERLKAVGSGHSWSPITQSGDAGISVEDMSGLVGFDRQKKEITVLAGTTLRELNKLLVRQGFALPVLGSIDSQTVAGAISTGTHGTGIHYGTLSSYVTRVRLVDGTGRVREFTEQDGAAFSAAQCSVGALGVLTQVTLCCEPAFRLECVEELRPVDDVLSELDDLVAGNDHFKFWWVPDTQWALTFRQNHTDAKPRGTGLKHRLQRDIMRNTALDLGLSWFSHAPGVIPIWNKLLTKGTPKRRVFVDNSYNVFTFPVHVKHRETEFALPIEHAREGFEALRALIEDENLKVGFITEVRFVKRDNAIISPAYGRDSVYIGAFQYHSMEHQEYFSRFSRAMSRFDGRPHWGKLHDLSGHELASRYPRWNEFAAVRADLDPHGVFLNRYLRDAFGI